MFTGSTSSYQVEEIIARGRSGETFRAIDTSGRTVALKVHDRADDGRAELHRLSTISHHGVVAPIDHGTNEQGKIWLALPWLEGQTLASLLTAEAPLGIERGQRMVDRIAEALDAVHSADVVHGDLSPKNIMVGPTDRITLIDFSVSAATDGIPEETAGLELTVTPRYAAPEVGGGARPSPASDRYALAIITYELLTGSFPFPEVATPLAVLAHHASSEPIAPSEHRPDLAPGIERALLQGLAKDPAARHGSAAEFASALRDDVDSSPLARHNDRRLAVVGVVAAVGLAVAAWTLATASRRSDVSTPVAVAERSAVTTGVPVTERADDERAEIEWIAGEARGLSCNSLTEPGFEAGQLPDHFYGGDPTNTVARRDGLGLDNSSALVVGGPSTFGLFGEVVPVVPEREHIFSVWVRRDGSVDTSAIYIDYLNSDFVQLTAARDALAAGETIESEAGTRLEVRAVAPPDAAFAVPTVFKDGSPGILIVDEAVFGLSETCPDLTS